MPPADPTRRDPGRWCDEHQRWECTKQRKGSGTCHGSRIAGVDRCRMHGGKRAEVLKAEGEAVTAWSALAGAPSVDPGAAVLGMLHMSWMRVHLFAGLLEQQVTEAQDAADGGGGSGVGVGAGLVGQTFSGVKDLGVFATGEQLRGLAQLEATERDRCVRFAKTAHDMGIAEREITIAEHQGEVFADAFFRILDALDLSVEQMTKAVEVMPRELRAIEGGAG